MYLICTYFNVHTAITQYIAYKQTIAPLYVVVLLFGGEAEIRTLEALLTPTRFPVVRPRPTRRLLHNIGL